MPDQKGLLIAVDGFFEAPKRAVSDSETFEGYSLAIRVSDLYANGQSLPLALDRLFEAPDANVGLTQTC